MNRVWSIAVLSIVNAISSVATLILVFGIISFAHIGTAPEGEQWLYLSFIIGFFAILDLLKWISYFRVSFRFSNAWLVYLLVYIALLIGIAILFSLTLIYLLVLFYIISVIVLYIDNKAGRNKPATVPTPRKKVKLDRFILIAMIFLLIPTLIESYTWFMTLLNLVVQPGLISFPFYIFEFILSTLIVGYSWYAVREIRNHFQSIWIHVFLFAFLIKATEMIAFTFFRESVYNFLGVLVEANPSAMLMPFFLLICYIVGYLLFIMRREKFNVENKSL